NFLSCRIAKLGESTNGIIGIIGSYGDSLHVQGDGPQKAYVKKLVQKNYNVMHVNVISKYDASTI
ncbi:hypothetical protein TI04_04650, partial [Achromatium sp. WMS2]